MEKENPNKREEKNRKRGFISPFPSDFEKVGERGREPWLSKSNREKKLLLSLENSSSLFSFPFQSPAPALLAFSGGIDSSALFHWLNLHKFPFDIALVNYKTRRESDKEMERALQLGKMYGKRVYVTFCKLPKFSENGARRCRYRFFYRLMEEYKYQTLILAHQLNDRLEWFLMELGKGAGVVEMVAMEEWEKRERFWIWRPFAFWSRREILEYLHHYKIPYSVDTTNQDLNFHRNFIRHTFADKFLSLYEKGVKKSFHYLERDKSELLPEIKEIGKVYFFPIGTPWKNLRGVDRIAKRLGVIMSASQRREILRQGFKGVISGKVAVDHNAKLIFVAPFVKISLGKIREKCRQLGIPPKIRGYVVKENLCDMLSTAISTAVWKSGRS